MSAPTGITDDLEYDEIFNKIEHFELISCQFCTTIQSPKKW